MVVSLRHRRAVSGKLLLAHAIGFQDAGVHLRRLRFQPREQRWTKVEADLGIVVDDLEYPPLIIDDSRRAIRGVALGGDTLVPIVKGIRRGLRFDGLQPRILSRRLIKVSMDANVTFHKQLIGCAPGTRDMQKLASNGNSYRCHK